jgi:hypothetical protein
MVSKSPNHGGVRPPRTTNRFRAGEIARAIRGIESTGGKAERVAIDPKKGTITVFIGNKAVADKAAT